MRRAGEPLRQQDHRLELGLFRRNGEGRGALDHVGVERRAIVSPRRAPHRAQQLLGIEQVGDNHVRSCLLQALAPSIKTAHDGAGALSLLEQLVHDCAAGLAGGAGHEDHWIGHEAFLSLLRHCGVNCR